MTDRTCGRCHKVFRYPSDLREHNARKTPCAPILKKSELSPEDQKKSHLCRYCGRAFSTAQVLSRHVRQNCKIANSEEGMEALFTHTALEREQAQQVLLERNAVLDQKVDQLQQQLEKLTLLVQDRFAAPALPAAPVGVQTAHTITNTSTQTVVLAQVQIGQVNILPWGSEAPIHVPLELVRAAFSENAKLRAFCTTGDNERLDADTAAPYVLEALLDLVRRAHRDPVQRNVYLNPRRADQVLVYGQDPASGGWEIVPLLDAIRRLFDGVAGQLHRLVLSDAERTRLPIDMQGAVGWVPIHYETEPEKYVGSARKSMTAHLENIRQAVAGGGEA